MATGEPPRRPILLYLVGAIAIIFILSRIFTPSPATNSPTANSSSPPSTSWDSGAVVASGGLACRDSATYDRIWKKVAGIMMDHGGDSLAAFAASHPGCRRLAEEGEPVQSFEIRGHPYAIELKIRGDSLPLYAHLLAIDTVCSVSWPC
jgi:hypothetical protein